MSELQRSQDVQVKRVAAEKLMFLINEQVEGVGQQAAFNIIELMGCTQLMSVKQVSYSIAPYILKETAEQRALTAEAQANSDKALNQQSTGQLLLLTPNIFMKDLKSLEGDC